MSIMGTNPKFDAIMKLLERRGAAVKSLIDSLAHLTREQQFVVLCAHIDLAELEHLAEEQARKTRQLKR